MKRAEMAETTANAVPRYVTGFSAAAVSLFFVLGREVEPEVAIASGFFLLACLIDTLRSRIPNVLTLALFTAGVIFNVWNSGLGGLTTAASGCAVGLSSLFIPYLMGGMGGGDVKAFGALGAILGPWPVFQVFLYTALFGGVLSVLHYAFAHNLREKLSECGRALFAFAGSGEVACVRPAFSEKLRFPYAAAIAFGYFAHVTWGGPL
jgi:prepilin peptidase CpaA